MRPMRLAFASFILLVACSVPAAESPSPSDELVVGAPSPTATSSQSRAAPPTSLGAAADAGVLYVHGSDDVIYRYEGASGTLMEVSRGARFIRESAEGAYLAGREGAVTLLRWDGSAVPVECGPGRLATVSAGGACASIGGAGEDRSSVHVRLAEEARARLALPQDWGAHAAGWSPDGQRLLLVRLIRPRPGPGPDPGLDALWILERGGELRELYRPREAATLSSPSWSPDGRYALVWKVATTSNSLAADGIGISLVLVEVASRATSELAPVLLNPWWARWSPDGRLAFVRGGGRAAWDRKEVVVWTKEGERLARGPEEGARSRIAPAWDARGRLLWVEGPSSEDLGGLGYLDGVGPGGRVGVLEDGAWPVVVRCAEGRVVEGVRPSADGRALLLLCRRVGRDPQPLELWLYRLEDGTHAPLVSGFVGVAGAGGFGYYGTQPSLFGIVAWSRAVR